MAVFEIGKALRNYDLGSPFTEAIENDASGLPIYFGRAKPGTAKSDANWQIWKLTYDGNGALTDKQFADGNNLFDNIWDSRATYSYS